MLYTLTNSQLSATISSTGAELQSLLTIAGQTEYMWSGDVAFWAKYSPLLFPIVGGLKNNSYQYKGNYYSLPRHGFSRENEFTVSDRSDAQIRFTLTDNEQTLLVYPFHFSLSVLYTLTGATLTVTYEVGNTGNEPMYFSIGAHPAFAVPLLKDTEYSDHYLAFNEKETAGKWPLSPDGLILEQPIELLKEEDRLPLTKELFYGDALVFKHLRSSAVSIRNKNNAHGLTLRYDDFPYMGIWSAKNADFVCIEPWCGIADSVHASGELTQKEGIHQLAAGEVFIRSWSVDVF